MATKVFISYRREEAKHQAKEIYNALLGVLQREDVFLDINSIPPTTDFVKFLQDRIAHSELVLVLIGAEWASLVNPKNGERRLYERNDFVRNEIQEAFARSIPVVPVHLDGARMPSPDELPEEIRDITRQQAEFVDFRTFNYDVQNLIKRLRIGRDWGAMMLRRAVVSGAIAGAIASIPFIGAASVVQGDPVKFRAATTLWGLLLSDVSLPQAFLISVFAGAGAALCGQTSGKRLIVCFVLAAMLVGAVWSEFFSLEIFLTITGAWLIATGVAFWCVGRWLGLPVKWNDPSAGKLRTPW